MILAEGVSVDPQEIEAIVNWKPPTNVTKIQVFWVWQGTVGSLLRGFQS